jgi:hypothetical protein
MVELHWPFRESTLNRNWCYGNASESSQNSVLPPTPETPHRQQGFFLLAMGQTKGDGLQRLNRRPSAKLL